MATQTPESPGRALSPTRDLRKTWAARAAAIGFVLAIAFGNLWAANAMMANPPPEWVRLGFSVGMIVAALSGLWLAGVAIYWRLAPRAEIREDLP